MNRRCGVTSHGGRWGCCRSDGHPGDHCAHRTDTLTGTPGVIAAARSMFGTTFTTCDGTENPAVDRFVASRAPGDRQTRFDLIPPTEGNTP